MTTTNELTVSQDFSVAPGGALQLTPSQTVGPYLHIALRWPDGADVVAPDAPGAIEVTGRIVDGAGDPVVDGLVETWQADADGRFAHPDDPRGAAGGFRGFGRCPTDASGSFRIRTVKPGPLPALGGGPDGDMEAPHIDVSVFARGLLDRVVTRIYFADEAAANAADPVFGSVPEARRHTLVATLDAATASKPAVPSVAVPTYRFDIRLQGEDETVFFAV